MIPIEEEITEQETPESLMAQSQFSNLAPEDGNNLGQGTIPATPEEQQIVDVVNDGIEQQIHGKFRDDLVELLTSTPELWNNVATASTMLLEGAYGKTAEQVVEVPPDAWFGENGIIQTTVEMVFEVANAIGMPGAEDDDQLNAAYMKVMTTIGEELYEEDDVAVAEAQQLMIDAEFGDGASDILEEDFESMETAETLMEEVPNSGTVIPEGLMPEEMI